MRIPAGVTFVALLVVAAASFWFVTAGTAQPVEAHAALVSSNPSNGEQVNRPPARVILNFSEPLERKLTQVNVTDIDGTPVDEGDIEFDDADPKFVSIGVPTLDPGLYIVEFDNVSTVDGHPWSGVFQFIVLNPDGSVPEGAEFDPDLVASGSTGLLPQTVDIITKWIAMLSVCIVAGAAFWVFAIARPAAAFLEEDDHRATVARAETWFTYVSHILLPLAFIAMSILILVTIDRFEVPTGLLEYLSTIQTGRYRAVFALMMLVALLGVDVTYLSYNRRLRSAGLTVSTLAVLIALLTFSLTSHGGTGAGSFWAISSDYIHLLTSSLWLGMLVMLAPIFYWSRRVLSEESRFLYLANVFDRFSIAAGVSVILILASGVFNGLVQLPSWSAWIDTTYGRVLLAKMVLLLPLLAVSGINAFFVKPRLVATIDELYQKGGRVPAKEQESAESRLFRLQRILPATIAIEVVLLLAVFVSVAVLTQTSTAKGELAANQAESELRTEFTDEKPAGDLLLTIAIQPNRVGLNEFELTIRNEDGTPANDLEQVRLRFFYTDPTNPDLNTGQSELLLNRFGEGLYRGSGAYFSQPGSWRVEAGIRRAGVDDVSRNFVVSVAPPEQSADDASGGRFELPFTTLSWNETLGYIFVVLAVIALLYAKPIAGRWSVDSRWVTTAGTALFISGAVLAFAIRSPGGSADFAEGNPVAPTDESVLAGRMLFQQNCIVCHGETGRGDGPQAAGLDPAPTDFRLHLPLHTDPQFFAFIANGYPGSAMPAWRDSFTDDEIWNLVNFMRSEFSEAPSALAEN